MVQSAELQKDENSNSLLLPGFQWTASRSQVGFVRTADGTNLFTSVIADGSATLLMGGSGKGVFVSDEVALQLASSGQVVSFDRRCTLRSSGNPSLPSDVGQQCQDIVAVLDYVGAESANIFTTCVSVAPALAFAEKFPKRIKKLVVHEPAMFRTTRESERHVRQFEEYVRVAFERSAVEGIGMFLDDFGLPFPERFRELVAEQGAHAMCRELLPSVNYLPDFEALRELGDCLIVAVGETALQQKSAFAISSTGLAELTGCSLVVFPGNHIGYLSDPKPFANLLTAFFENQIVRQT